MATLENIRRRGPLVAIIIGFALLAFILGDFLNSGSSLLQGGHNKIAEVAGKTVPAELYQQKVSELENAYRNQGQLNTATTRMVREQVWEEIIRNYILEDEYDELGLAVNHQSYDGISPDEVYDMVNGRNIDPMIRRLFTDPQTGQFDPANVSNFLRQLPNDPNGQAMAQWLQIEKELLNKRIYTKYNNLITQGLFVNTIEAKQAVQDRNRTVSISFVEKKFFTVPDSAISFTESDLKDYYNNHKYLYKQDQSRDIAYVAFDIYPSSTDSAIIKEDIYKYAAEFEKAEDSQVFGRRNTILGFTQRYYSRDNLTTADSVLFDAEIGSMNGPYIEDGFWKASKLTDVKNVPDSIRVRHILIQSNQQTGDISQATAAIDSLKNLIEGGADFGMLAAQFSEDPGSSQEGGEYFFAEGTMVPEFNQASIDGAIGALQVVETDYGVHLLEVLARNPEIKKVEISTISLEIDASITTEKMVYAEAGKFAAESRNYKAFQKNTTEKGFSKRIANNITPNTTEIAGLESPQELVKAIYEGDKNKMLTNPRENDNPVFELGNRYIVAYVTAIREEGFADFDAVKDEIAIEVVKQKKAEKLEKEFETAMASGDLNSLANDLNTDVRTSNGISFSAFQIPGLGAEPKVIAVATGMEKGEVSKPIKGNAGVYVVRVDDVNESGSSDYSSDLSRMTNDVKSRSGYQVYQALKEKANIKDFRYKFY